MVRVADLVKHIAHFHHYVWVKSNADDFSLFVFPSLLFNEDDRKIAGLHLLYDLLADRERCLPLTANYRKIIGRAELVTYSASDLSVFFSAPTDKYSSVSHLLTVLSLLYLFYYST